MAAQQRRAGENLRAHEAHHARASHPRAHGHHAHTHGVVDASLLTADRGIWAVKWSLALLGVTALLQSVVVVYTGSVALFADVVHNFGDAATAVPLWVAFALAKRPASRRFTYGYGRVEDIAGIAVVLTILVSAVVAGAQSIDRILHPQPMEHVWVVAMAGIIGFLGNEAVARFRIRIGREINSAALLADGHHARADGFTSLGVVAGAAGTAVGFQLADPIVGLVITAVILRMVWKSGRTVLTRVADGVDPEVVDEIEGALKRVEGVEQVADVRARWSGHRLLAEASLAVDPLRRVGDGHDIAVSARDELLRVLPYLSDATIHVDPAERAGNAHH